ncbi:MAG: hypothetical protein V4457_09840 [Pseudomonadota bacterium]
MTCRQRNDAILLPEIAIALSLSPLKTGLLAIANNQGGKPNDASFGVRSDMAFAGYHNDRNFEGDPEADGAGDLMPEGVLFIPAQDSPTRQPLLVVAHEISSSAVIYGVIPESSATP